MDDLRDAESSGAPATQVSREERRQMLEKRIYELRKRKRQERRKSARPVLRIMPVVLLIAFFFLCPLSSVFAFLQRGGGSQTVVSELPASNAADMETVAANSGKIAEPAVPAVAAYLMDPDTGDVLYQKNPDKSYPMASTTKIMTAIVAIENCSLDQTMQISDRAAAVGESSAWLSKGETLTAEQLLYCLLLQSANDAAVALGEGIAGSEQAFVQMMNDKASQLGLADTHFSNTHGLDAKGHYTSAHDLAMIAAYAMQNPTFRKIVGTRSYELAWPGHPSPRVFENHNKLLSTYQGATGMKTGYTANAGKCLVASAERDGRQLISVVLNGGDGYWDESTQLLDYGFDSFSRVEFAYSGQSLGKIDVGNFPTRKVAAVSASDLVFTVRNDYLKDFGEATVSYAKHLSYPVEQGQEVGDMVVGEGTPAERRVPLESDSKKTPPNILFRFFAFTGSVFAVWLKVFKWIIPGI
jgi:D-alanyl-D-alanine carboxypeptidase (penicillin-binding protein 5/6)